MVYVQNSNLIKNDDRQLIESRPCILEQETKELKAQINVLNGSSFGQV